MDELAPIAATVAVDRRAPVKSSRSTLATMADLEPYLAALFSREAIPRCPEHDLEAVDTTPRDAASSFCRDARRRAAPLCDVPGAWPTTPSGSSSCARSSPLDGYRRLVALAGAVREIDEVRPSEATAPGVRLEVVVDRVGVGKRDARRLQEAIEAAWSRSGGRGPALWARRPWPMATAPRRSCCADAEPARTSTVARGLVCPTCARAFEPPRPGLFSYNSPFGACDACRGFGRVIAIDWDKVIPDQARRFSTGRSIKPNGGPSTTWERKASC